MQTTHLTVQVFTSDHALKLDWIPKWIAIIGSGYIGLEFSDVYTALGSEVTFIEAGLLHLHRTESVSALAGCDLAKYCGVSLVLKVIFARQKWINKARLLHTRPFLLLCAILLQTPLCFAVQLSKQTLHSAAVVAAGLTSASSHTSTFAMCISRFMMQLPAAFVTCFTDENRRLIQ